MCSSFLYLVLSFITVLCMSKTLIHVLISYATFGCILFSMLGHTQLLTPIMGQACSCVKSAYCFGHILFMNGDENIHDDTNVVIL